MSATKKKIRPGTIQLSEDGTALEVQYESQDIAVLPSGEERVQSSKKGTKRLPIQFTAGTDVAQVAQQLLASSKLIHPSRLADVESLVQQAWDRWTGQTQAQEADRSTHAPHHNQHSFGDQDRSLLRQQQQQYALASPAQTVPSSLADDASVERLQEYMEALYDDDLAVKVAATARITRLFESHLQELVACPPLLQALARLLREDHKRSGELALNLVTAFLLMSHQRACLPLLVQNHVGSLCLDIVDLELRRAEHWQTREGLSVAELSSKLKAGDPLTEREARLAAQLGRQEALLFTALHLLLNMAQDGAVEAKMVKKGLLGHLVALLDRASANLLVLITTFLRKLSVYAENRAALADVGVVARLVALVAPPLPGGSEELLRSALRLLHNLSFEPELRAAMAGAGVIGRAVGLLAGASEAARHLALCLLYHLSLEDKHRSMFLYTDALPRLHALLMAAPAGLVVSAPELVALVGNLAEHRRVGEEMARLGHVEPLLQRAAEGRETLLWHVARCLSTHDSEVVRTRFVPCLPALVALLMSPESGEELVVEVLGTLANLDMPSHDYLPLLQSTSLHNWLLARLTAPDTPEPLLLEAVGALVTLCSHSTAGLLAEAGLVGALQALVVARMDDEPFVLHTTVTAHRLLLHGPTRDALLQRPELAARFAELLEHGSKEVSRAADAALDCVAGLSAEWAASVRRLRFEAHNRLWIEQIAVDGSGGVPVAPDVRGALAGGWVLAAAPGWSAMPEPALVASH